MGISERGKTRVSESTPMWAGRDIVFVQAGHIWAYWAGKETTSHAGGARHRVSVSMPYMVVCGRGKGRSSVTTARAGGATRFEPVRSK